MNLDVVIFKCDINFLHLAICNHMEISLNNGLLLNVQLSENGGGHSLNIIKADL